MNKLASFVLLTLTPVIGCGRPDPMGPVANLPTADKIHNVFATATGGGGQGGGAVSTGTGWGTLRGQFTYDGQPPEMPGYNVTKEFNVCAPGGTAPPQETLVVDPDTKGVANVVVYLWKATRVHESAQPKNEVVVFDQKDCVFLSHVFPVTIGQTMLIKNSDPDPVGHNTNVSGKNAINPTIPAGQSLDFKPQKEESYPTEVSCSIHPWMKSYYMPRKNGYYAVTKKDGTFEIANLPAGENLQMQVWHESAVPKRVLVVNTPDAKKLKWSKKGRFKLKLEPDEVREIQMSIPASAFGG